MCSSLVYFYGFIHRKSEDEIKLLGETQLGHHFGGLQLVAHLVYCHLDFISIVLSIKYVSYSEIIIQITMEHIW